MAKVTLEWKAPSDKQMQEFVGQFDNQMKKDFAKTCVVMKDGKATINKSKAKQWLTSKFDGTDEIEWKGRPINREKKLSAADTIASWLEL